jgi:hypothetical protein
MNSLWVLPTPGHSAWFAKIDWYLNWQMTRGLTHEARQPSTTLMRLTREHGLPDPIPAVTSPVPLMVSARGRVAAEQCVVIGEPENLSDWLKRVHQLIQALNHSSARIHLPTGASRPKADELWKTLSKQSKISIEFIVDEEAATWPIQSVKKKT